MSARYVKALRERRRAAGLVPVEVWVRAEDRERLRAYAARLAKRAAKPAPETDA